MNYSEALEYMEELSRQSGSNYSLQGVAELAARVGNPEKRVKTVHIAGTNGKGSVGNYISSILASSGYTVGRYVSPAVFDYRERIQRMFSGKEGEQAVRYISKEESAETIAMLKGKSEEMVSDGFCQPTAFEIETVMAFLLFEKWGVDIAVVECGLGGRLDATNIVENPLLCVFTSISPDHMKILGNSVAEIAAEKYGIIKDGTSVVSKWQADCAEILKEVCRLHRAELTFMREEALQEQRFLERSTVFVYKGREYTIGQAGVFQPENAAIAIEAVSRLCERGFGSFSAEGEKGLPLQGAGQITEETVRDGLHKSHWKGRFEVVSETPFLLADGAHNQEAAEKLCLSLEKYFPGEKFSFVIGVFRDKEYEKIFHRLVPLAKQVYAVTAPGERGLPGSEICAWFRERKEIPVHSCGGIQDALKLALTESRDGRTVVCGSLSILKEVYAMFPK